MSQNWELVPLHRLPIEIVDGDRSSRYPKRDEFQSQGVVFLNSTNIVENRLSLAECNRISEEKYETIHKGRTRHLDIVMTTRGSIGKVALVDQRVLDQGLINAQMLLMRADATAMDPIFLFYVTCGGTFQSELRNFASGSAQPQIPITDLRRVTVPVPPLPTQRKIAAILSAYDDLIESNLRRIKILEEMAQNLYREWFVKFRFPGHERARFVDSPLGRIPEGWEIVTIGDLIEIRKGRSITRNTIVPGSVPVIAGGMGPAYYHNVANTRQPVITISASGANAGFVRLYHENVWASDCSVIDLSTTPYVYFFYLQLSDRQIDVTRLQRGSAQPHVYPKDLMALDAMRIPISILERFSGDVTPYIQMTRNLMSINTTLRRTRDLLLPRLISGEVDVSELEIAVSEEAVC